MKAFCTLIILFISINTFSQNLDSIRSQANNKYSEGNYEEAAKLYDSIASYGESADLYYNLGNTYFKQNMYGKARLYYERALRLAPTNHDIINNLQFTKSLQTDKIDEVKPMVLAQWYKSTATSLSPSTWSILFFTLTGMSLSILLIFFFTKRPRNKKIALGSLLLLTFVTISCFILGNKCRFEQIRKDEAIVSVPVIMVKNQPNSNGSDLFIIHEGLKIKVIENKNGWTRVMLYDNKSQGWVQSNEIDII